MSAPDIFERIAQHAGAQPTATAVTAPGRAPLAYAALRDQISRTRGSLSAFGVGAGDVVAVALANGPELATAILGTMATAASAPLNPGLRALELRAYLTALAPRALLVAEGDASPAVEVARSLGISILTSRATAAAGTFDVAGSPVASSSACPVAPDVALLLHTSGTTSRPKRIPLTRANVAASAQVIAETLALTPDDRCLNVMPLFHVHGLMAGVVASLAAGASVSCTPGFYATDVFAWLRDADATWYTAVPAMHQAILVRAASHADILGRLRLRLIRSSSAPLSPRVLAALEDAFGCPVVEAYGMTEATHQVASNPLPPGVRKPGSVGRPTGTQITVIGANGQPLPAGERGEVVIRGAAVTAGDRAGSDDIVSADGTLRTGDEGYLDADGYLFLTGRIKEIINRGGEKISPHEVEDALAHHPAVAAAVAFALPDPALGETVGAAVVLRSGQTLTELTLRRFVADRLADFKVPEQVAFVSAIPTGLTGKVQRVGLAATLGLPSRATPATASPFAAPRTEREAWLVELWAEVLGCGRVGVDDEFLDLGGDSMLAARLLARLRERLDVEASLVDLFAYPTVSAQARWIETLLRQRPARHWTIPRRPASGRPPLAPTQLGMWLQQQIEPGNVSLNTSLVLELAGDLDAGFLQRALDHVIARHATLRTTFALDRAGEPYQVIHAATSLAIEQGAVADRAAILAHVREAARRPFDLTHGPLVRATLLRVAPREHVLVLIIHHIACDGWSREILVEELAAHYEALAQGGAPEPEPLAIDYADLAAWAAQDASGAKRAEAFWREKLAELPAWLTLPVDVAEGATGAIGTDSARHDFVIDAPLAEALARLAREERATLYMTVLAAFQILLGHYACADDVIVTTPVAGRVHPDAEPLIGCFMNIVALRARIDARRSFRAALGGVRASVLAALSHDELPFVRVVELVPTGRSRELLRVLFQVRNVPHARRAHAGGLDLRSLDVDDGLARAALALEVSGATEAAGLRGHLQYATALFAEPTAGRIVDDLRRVLRRAADHPDDPVDLLVESMGLPNAVRLQPELDRAAAGVCTPSVVARFAAQVARRPEAIAVVSGEETWTYARLDAVANRVARRLHGFGLDRGRPVVLMAGRTPHHVAGLLGILKAGGAFLPLDPRDPEARLRDAIADAQPAAVVTPAAVIGAAAGLPRVVLDDDADEAGSSALDREPDPDQPAYVMYTSGSTGRPKGVVVRHGGLANLLTVVTAAYGLSERDRVLQFSPLTFDSAVEETLAPLASGATLVLRGEDWTGTPGLFLERCRDARITVLDMATAYWHELVDALPANTLPATLRLTVVGGEPIRASACRHWFEHTSVRLLDGYGVTEATVTSTLQEIRKDRAPDDTSIGRPLPGVTMLVLDPRLRPLPPGVSGELCLTGAGLALGYLNRPELTAVRFPEAPAALGLPPGARLYRTGDRASYDTSGVLHYFGRLDGQVKIRGFRVEPDEIERVLAAHPAVRLAAVTARPDRTGALRLVAYAVAPGASPAELRGHLQSRLPSHMVPSAVTLLDALPLTRSGKIDRAALPEPPAPSGGDHLVPVGPVAELVASIWQEVLEAGPVGMADDFFELGGDSLRAARMLSRVHAAFGIELPFRLVFDAPTLAAFVHAVEDRPGGATDGRSQ